MFLQRIGLVDTTYQHVPSGNFYHIDAQPIPRLHIPMTHQVSFFSWFALASSRGYGLYQAADRLTLGICNTAHAYVLRLSTGAEHSQTAGRPRLNQWDQQLGTRAPL